jgi:hypothetical protein
LPAGVCESGFADMTNVECEGEVVEVGEVLLLQLATEASADDGKY